MYSGGTRGVLGQHYSRPCMYQLSRRVLTPAYRRSLWLVGGGWQDTVAPHMFLPCGTLSPAAGAVVAAVETAVGRPPLCCGKVGALLLIRVTLRGCGQ